MVNNKLTSGSGKNLPAAISDIGCEREINEDRYAVLETAGGRVWAVCDGMGGTVGGELAAQLAIDSMQRKLETSDSGAPSNLLKAAIEEANRIIVLRRSNPAFREMGTTVTAVFIAQNGDDVVISSIGDTRAYLLSEDSITQLTRDDTYVQDLVDRGAISEDEADIHPQAHVLTNCLGNDIRLNVENKRYYVSATDKKQSGDSLLLCSDGLYSLVSDEDILGVARANAPQEACIKLVEMAKAKGGYDNITVMILPLNGVLKDEPSPQHKEVKERRQEEITAARPRMRKVQTPAAKLAISLMSFCMGGLVAAIILVAVKLAG